MSGVSGWLSTTSSALRHHGASFAFGRAARYLVAPLALAFKKTFRTPPAFALAGKHYQAAWHLYNQTWTNERSVELALALAQLEGRDPSRILEIGNVLSWYLPIQHTVVDRYETGRGVVNVDVIDLDLRARFDLILAISTLEHVGWDESPRDPEKPSRAISVLRRHLAPEGIGLVTLPLGYNPHVTDLLMAGRLEFHETHFMKRVSRDNRWVQATWEEVRMVRWGKPYRGANGLLIGWLRPVVLETEPESGD